MAVSACLFPVWSTSATGPQVVRQRQDVLAAGLRCLYNRGSGRYRVLGPLRRITGVNLLDVGVFPSWINGGFPVAVWPIHVDIWSTRAQHRPTMGR